MRSSVGGRLRNVRSAAPHPENGLVVRGLTTGYVHAPILRDVSISVAPGEIVAILGANGAGKTTLLRAVSGVLRSWRGKTWLNGGSLDGLQPWTRVYRGLAHVPEGRHVFHALSVEDNLRVAALSSRRHGREKVEVTDVFDRFPKLAARRTQLAGSLSGGEQQMLAIGRALMTSPSALLVDEMSAGLAPVIVDRLLDTLVELRDSGMAIALVEQSPTVVSDVASRIYLLDGGTIVAEGTFSDLGGAERLAEVYLGVR